MIEYKSKDEKENLFNYYQVEDKDSLDKILKEFNSRKEEYVYRGVANSHHKLLTSSQRFWLSNGLTGNDVKYDRFLFSLILELHRANGGVFKKFFEQFSYKVADFAALSFLQHNGCPTPLLDFTKNINVALFFAIQYPYRFC